MEQQLPEYLVSLYTKDMIENNLTIKQLCDKYSIVKEQLGPDFEDLLATKLIPTSKHLKPIEHQPSIVGHSSEKSTQDKIEKFKQAALDHATSFMQDDAKFADVKDFKDIVKVVMDIEASYKDSQPDNVINIAIQNIVKNFEDDV